MIHATNHPDGAILMADNIFKHEELLREIHSGKQKGILLAELAELSKANEYGISLISLNEDYRKKNRAGRGSLSRTNRIAEIFA